MRVTPENYSKSMGVFYESNVASIKECTPLSDDKYISGDSILKVANLKYDHRQCFTSRGEAVAGMRKQLSDFVNTISKEFFAEQPFELTDKLPESTTYGSATGHSN